MRHEHGVADQHARGLLMRLEYGNRFAGLNKQGFIVFECLKGLHDGMKTVPVACGFSGAAVHN